MLELSAINLDALAVLNSVPGNHLILLPNTPLFTIVGVTDSYAEVTYTKRDEIIGRNLFDVFPDNPDDKDATGVKNLQQSLNHVISTRKVHRMANQRYDVINAFTGAFEFKIWSPSNKPVLDEFGNVAFIIHTVEDVTNTAVTEGERQKALSHLRDSEDRFRNLVRDATAAIIVLTGEEMKVEIVNEAYGKLINLAPDDLLGKPIFSVIPDAAAYYLPILEKVRKTGEKIFLHESPYSVVTNGTLIEGFLHVVYQPYRNNAGQVVGVMAILQDVTDSVKSKKALEASENRFKNVIEEATVGTALLEGPEWVLSIANDQMLQLWQRDRAVIGKKLLDFMPELIGQPFPNILKAVYESGTTYSANDALVKLNRNDSLEDVYMDFSYKALRNGNGEIYAILVAAADVTERFFARKKLEESENRFRQLSEKLEHEVELRTSQLKKSNEDLQQFAHVASHDLKEPVRKIKTFGYRLQDELKQQSIGRQKQFVDKILSAADRMAMMIDGVLAFSALDSFQQRIEMVNLNEVIDAIRVDLEVAIDAKTATITCEKLPTVEGASVLLYQLFYNLINNALKFAREDVPLQISISVDNNTATEKESVTICIADNGIGFDQKFASRIFESFARLNSKDEYEGTGLGLALCKKILERHQGVIKARGTLGTGAEFFITLPLKQKT